MALFIKSVRARRLQRHQQFNPLGARLPATAIQHTVGATHTYTPRAVRPEAAPKDTARNRKLLARKANYQGHERPGMAVRVSVTGCAAAFRAAAALST